MRLKVTVAYDGTGFDGWQKQATGRTVQKTLETMLMKIHKHAVKVIGSGRTDAGVHAEGQVFHFDTELQIPNERWIKAMNAILPDDIRVHAVEIVSDAFHARFSATSKTYRYRVNCGPFNLFERNQVYQLNQPVDCSLMREAALFLIGTHDFTSFNATSKEEIPDQIRTISAIEITEDQNYITFVLTGNGFLRYMVRMIVAALLEIGRARLPMGALHDALTHPDKQSLNMNIPSCGLTLMNVSYEIKRDSV